MPPYDEAARSLGAEVATPEGGSLAAIADLAILAYGSMPDGFVASPLGYVRGTHDGIDYVYSVWCRDSRGRTLPCGETTASVRAMAGWAGTMPNGISVFHQGTWDLGGLHGGLGLVSGSGWSTYGLDGALYVMTETHLVVDYGAMRPLGGSLQATIDVFDTADGSLEQELGGDVVFDVPARPTIVLDDHRYWLDIATGEVTAATVLE